VKIVDYPNGWRFQSQDSPGGLDGITLRAINSQVFVIGGPGNDDIMIVRAREAVVHGDAGFITAADQWSLSTFNMESTLSGVSGDDRIFITSFISEPFAQSTYRPSRSIVFGGPGNDVMDVNVTVAIICGDYCTCKSSEHSHSVNMFNFVICH
jgi:hypothetical protein